MYNPNIEAMPRDLKREIVDIVFYNTFFIDLDIDDLISLEDAESSEYDFTEFIDAFTGLEFPDYWIIVEKNITPGAPGFLIVFETLLTETQENAFVEALNTIPRMDGGLCVPSLSEKYGIY